jgi:hypothetical protein
VRIIFLLSFALGFKTLNKKIAERHSKLREAVTARLRATVAPCSFILSQWPSDDVEITSEPCGTYWPN